MFLHNSKNLKIYTTKNSYDLDNLPNDIEILMIECEPCNDLVNLPVTLQHIYFNNKNISFETEEIVQDKNISLETEEIVQNKNVESQIIDGSTLIINNFDRFSSRDGSYFNYIQPYKQDNSFINSGINTYSFALYPENTRIYRIKIPFGCKIYKFNNEIVNFSGLIKIKNY